MRRNYNELRNNVLELLRKAENEEIRGTLRSALRKADFLHKIRRYSEALDLLEGAIEYYHQGGIPLGWGSRF